MTEEYFWLIEARRKGGLHPEYATCEFTSSSPWTFDPFKAARFPSKEAANRVLADLKLYDPLFSGTGFGPTEVNAVEHSFSNTQTPSSSAMAAAREAAEELTKELGYSGDRAKFVSFIERTILKHMQIPEGWVLVPREPTQEMLDATAGMLNIAHVRGIYRLMIAAAPPKGDEG